MLELNLDPIFKARGIDDAIKILKNAGIPRDTVYELVAGVKTSPKFKYLEILCQVLNCEPNDLFVYKPDNKNPLPQGHALFNLKEIKDQQAIGEILENMPYKQLKNLAPDIIKKKDQPDD